MAEATQKEAEKKPLPGSPEARESGRRNLNTQIAQRQKMLLAGIGAIALIGGGMFIFGGDGDEGGSDAKGVLQLGIDMCLALHVGNRAIGLGHIERDRALGECFEDAGCQTCEAQTPFDEPDSEAEAARHIFGGSPCLDDGSEGLCLVGGVHREALEVLGKTGFAHFAFLAFDDEAGDLVVLGQGALFGQRLQCDEPATAGLDLELASLSFAHDEVLQQAARSNVCPQLEVGQHVARLANVARTRDKLLQGKRLDHGCSPDGMKAQVRITRPTSPRGSLHSHSEIGVCPRDQAASAGRTDEAVDTGTNSRVR